VLFADFAKAVYLVRLDETRIASLFVAHDNATRAFAFGIGAFKLLTFEIEFQ
jgi:hypothetical protein